MSDADALLWTIGRDPLLRTTVVALAVLDKMPDPARLRERLELATTAIPRLHQRVREPATQLMPPEWVDTTADLSFHLRTVMAPEPGDMRAVLDLAAATGMAGFDRSRPLWEFTVVGGLRDGRAALIEKFHHSVTDGEGGIRLALLLLDADRDATEPPDLRIAESSSPSLAARLGSVGAGTIRLLRGSKLVRSPVEVVRIAESVARMLRPVHEPLSPVMWDRSLSWRFDQFDVGLGDLRAAAKVAGGSINDAFVAAVAGGLRRYHEVHAARPDWLRMTMPISFREEGDAIGTNRFAPARFAVPVSVTDPVERMRRIGRIVREWQAEPALGLTDLLAGALYRLPPPVTAAVFGSMLKSIDFVATNITGFTKPVYLAGAQLLRQYAFAPPSGAAVNVALVSHLDQACIGVNQDRAAVPDSEVFIAALRDGFDEVISVVPSTIRARAS